MLLLVLGAVATIRIVADSGVFVGRSLSLKRGGIAQGWPAGEFIATGAPSVSCCYFGLGLELRPGFRQRVYATAVGGCRLSSQRHARCGGRPSTEVGTVLPSLSVGHHFLSGVIPARLLGTYVGSSLTGKRRL